MVSTSIDLGSKTPGLDWLRLVYLDPDVKNTDKNIKSQGGYVIPCIFSSSSLLSSK